MNLSCNETRGQWALAILLAMTAGYLDGYGLLFLGTYVSFMSGNTTSTGLRSGQGNFHAAIPTAVAILFFVIGSFFANLLSQSSLRHRQRIMFGFIASIMATVVGLERGSLRNVPFEIALLCLAMGMMNPALSEVGKESVSLTFVTGTLNRMGGHLASAVARKPLLGARGPRDSHLARAGIAASVWGGFLVGAVLSGIAGSILRPWALLPPCSVTLALSLLQRCLLRPPRERTISAITSTRTVASLHRSPKA
jgi:uncharacterized membrane protein YoaK (UPF0700 family)